MTSGENKRIRREDVPLDELVRLIRTRFWARAETYYTEPMSRDEFDNWDDRLNSFALIDVIKQGRDRSFETCVAPDGYLTAKWSSYRLAAAIACALIARRQDYVVDEPKCRDDLHQLLGDISLPDRDEDGPNTYVRVCAMDAADVTIRLVEDGAVELGAAPLLLIGPMASRFADSLAEVETDPAPNLYELTEQLAPHLQEMGEVVRTGGLPEPDPDPPPDNAVAKPKTGWGWPLACAGALVVGALIGTFGLQPPATGKRQTTTTATSTTTATVTTAGPETGVASPPTMAALAAPVVPKVLALVTATAITDQKTVSAVPWKGVTAPLALDLNANNRLRVVATLSLAAAQPNDETVFLTPSKPGGIHFTEDKTFINEPNREHRKPALISGEPIEITLAGNGQPSIFTTELYVKESSVSTPGEEFAVLTCGDNLMAFQVLLSINPDYHANVTVPVPLQVSKNC